MSYINTVEVTNGVYWVEIPDEKLFILCGTPADSVKHLMKRGLIVPKEKNGTKFESGPNAILLSDVMLQNGNLGNMGEFPVLQMLYRQGMLLPNHPNNSGEKPLLIGSESQVNAQKEYICRGNYGLTKKEEMRECGVDSKTADELMRMKLSFAFGKIHPTDDFLDIRIIKEAPIEIKNSVIINRKGSNVFELSYKNESTIIDLNLKDKEEYQSPYNLGYYNIKREYFGVIHSGQGDGWDINRPTMSSILMFQGKIYLIDAGPNILYILNSLGIGVNEIEGIFQTHAHDDHFAGLTTLMRADHKIKYFAHPLVCSSVKKKLSALLSINEDSFYDYFDVQRLKLDKWNYIDGLEVRPVLSPHPIETTILFFRTIWEGRYKTYAHLADIASFNVLEKMIVADESKSGISIEFFKKTKKEYLQKCDLKKLDVGGGLIHGRTEDFKDDKSQKIILAHNSQGLTNKQKEIGSSAPFGIVDVLIPVVQDYHWRFAYHHLVTYFPSIPNHQIHVLLNCEIVTFNPGSIIAKESDSVKNVYLTLSGTVEMIHTESDTFSKLSTGALIGESASLLKKPIQETYIAINYVQALKIPVSLFLQFIKTNSQQTKSQKLMLRRQFLQRTYLFGDEISYSAQNKIVAMIEKEHFPIDYVFNKINTKYLHLIVDGAVERYSDDRCLETLDSGDYFGERTAIFNMSPFWSFKVIKPLKVYKIHASLIDKIPIIRWKLFEKNEKLRQLLENQKNG